MSIENMDPLEQLLKREIERMGRRLGAKGLRCTIVVSATDGTNGATTGGGAWRNEIDRAIMLKESMTCLEDNFAKTMIGLAELAVGGAGNA